MFMLRKGKNKKNCEEALRGLEDEKILKTQIGGETKTNEFVCSNQTIENNGNPNLERNKLKQNQLIWSF